MSGEPLQEGVGPRCSENLEARSFTIEGPLLIVARRFGDACGYFAETLSARDFAAIGIRDLFVQDNRSRSASSGKVRGDPTTRSPTRPSARYAPSCDGGILWNDPALGINWGVTEDSATLSDKDRRLPTLAELAQAAF